jgi:uroporphyrinogen decarboxylase
MPDFVPDARHIIDAATNRKAARLPLYEHGFDPGVVEKILGEPVVPLLSSTDFSEKVEGWRRMCRCALDLGYDCIPFERWLVNVVQNGEGLKNHVPPIIENLGDIERYPWDTKVQEFIDLFDADFCAMREALPEGMQAVGGIGCGLFETVQDFVPYLDLAYLRVDEPDAYAMLWKKTGDLMAGVWTWFLKNHAGAFAVCRFGDDLGFRSSTLLLPDDIRTHVIPQYKRVIDLVHAAGKPFLLHSCGRIYEVMEDLIAAGIDAKHSNEDAIDPFDVWVNTYGARIGNFGGVEMNIMTLNTPDEVKAYVLNLLERVGDKNGGLAIGTGNQISPYTKPANWIAMTRAVRAWRGE